MRCGDLARTQASAPPEVSAQLRLTSQAEADTWQQAADAATCHDLVQAADAQALAGQIAAQRQRFEAASTRYEEWFATTSVRETGANARAELERRSLVRQPAAQRQPGPASGPPAMTGWWQQFETDSGIILDYGVQAGNPPDAPQLAPAISQIARRAGRTPRSVTADRGYGEPATERELQALGIRTIAIPRRARPSAARRAVEHARGFRTLVN